MSKARQFIKDYTRSCSNIEYTQGVYTPSYHPWLTPEQALAAVEIAKEELIEKVCEWLKEQDEMVGVSFKEDFIIRFKNYMKGE